MWCIVVLNWVYQKGRDFSSLNVLLSNIVANLMSKIQRIPCEPTVIWTLRAMTVVWKCLCKQILLTYGKDGTGYQKQFLLLAMMNTLRLFWQWIIRFGYELLEIRKCYLFSNCCMKVMHYCKSKHLKRSTN